MYKKYGGIEMNREQMLVELEQYYEAAGFKDIYINKLKDMTDEEYQHFIKIYLIMKRNKLHFIYDGR